MESDSSDKSPRIRNIRTHRFSLLTEELLYVSSLELWGGGPGVAGLTQRVWELEYQR